MMRHVTLVLECTCAAVRKAPIELDGNTKAGGMDPALIDDSLTTWLGTLWSHSARNAGLRITTTISRPDSGDKEAAKRLLLSALCLVVLSRADVGRVLLLSGEVGNHGRLAVKSWRQPPDFRLPFAYGTGGTLNAKSLHEAWKAAGSLLGLNENTRLSRGFYVLEQALRLHMLQERLHQMVRALEALANAHRGETWVKRCMSLLHPTGDSRRRRILWQMYNVRSAVEHVDDGLDRLYGNRQTRENSMWRLAAQAEYLALHAYSALLRDDSLMHRFKDCRRIRKFWNLAQDEQRRLWGGGIDLLAETRNVRRRAPRVRTTPSW